MKNTRQWILTGSFALAALGFLLPLWQLSALGVCLAALSGYSIFAFGVGLLLDIAWGTPTGALHYVVFPFALLSLLVSAARIFAGKYMLKKSPQETL